MKLKVEMCAKRDFIRKYINTDEEYIRAQIKDGGYAKFNIKVLEQTILSRQDYFMRCSFIVETCLESYTFNKEMYYADGQIFLQELTESEGVTPASTVFYAYPIKEKKEESQPEEEKRIHNIFAIVKINHCATFERRFISLSSTSFKKITLAPAIESIYYYTVYEKDYMNKKELDNAWMIYSIHTEPLFINGHSYDTKTVVIEQNAIQDIIFVKDNFNIVMDILKDLKERASRDINSSYPTGSMIKETKEKEKMSTVMVDSKEYSETYRLANLYKKEHEVKNLLKNTGKISYNPGIKDIKFNGPATIVFWNDGSKTVVKKGSGETNDDRKKAIIMAILKKNKEDYKIIENTFNSEDPELALAISLLKRNGYTKDILNKIYNKYKPKEEVKPKKKTTTKSKKKIKK